YGRQVYQLNQDVFIFHHPCHGKSSGKRIWSHLNLGPGERTDQSGFPHIRKAYNSDLSGAVPFNEKGIAPACFGLFFTFIAKSCQPAFYVSLKLLSALVFWNDSQHILKGRDLLGGGLRASVDLFSFNILRWEVGRHRVTCPYSENRLAITTSAQDRCGQKVLLFLIVA